MESQNIDVFIPCEDIFVLLYSVFRATASLPLNNLSLHTEIKVLKQLE